MMDLRKLRYSVRFYVPYFSEAEAFDLAPAARALPGLANLLALKLEARLEDLRNGDLPPQREDGRGYSDCC